MKLQLDFIEIYENTHYIMRLPLVSILGDTCISWVITTIIFHVMQFFQEPKWA